MPYISNYREKTLLLTHYFCEKQKKEVTPEEVYDMWCNWFKHDFRLEGKPTFKMVNGSLRYYNQPKGKEAEQIRKQYNQIFKDAYKWIKKSVKNECNTKMHFKHELDRERKKGFAKILTLAKPVGLYVTLGTNNLYKNKLGYYQLVKDYKVVTGGDCDKMIEYLKKYKEEKSSN